MVASVAAVVAAGAAAAAVAVSSAQAAPVEVSCLSGGQVVPGHSADALAWAVWADDVAASGESHLWVTTKSGVTPSLPREEAYCAGMAEGFVSATRVNDFWASFRESQGGMGNETIRAEMFRFAAETHSWSQLMVRSNAGTGGSEGAYWTEVDLILQQVQGLADGYNAAPSSAKPQSQYDHLSVTDIFLLNMVGDLDDLVPAIRCRLDGQCADRGIDDSDDRVREVILGSHCSAMVKPAPDFSDLFVTHTMWASYFQLYNTFKHYEFGRVPIHMSSYPGLVSSEDDFYNVAGNTKMIVLETTNGVFNMSLYSAVTPKSLMSWIRVMASNRLATDGQSWVGIMQKYNSGTYNNQWMVVDMKKFTPGAKTLAPGTLWIGSQLPGYWFQEDVTHVVNSKSYWPSYNIPYFKQAYELAGYPAMVQKQGTLWSYDECPRAQIFRRDHKKATDIPSVAGLIRYNNWEHDELSRKCPLNQIASRLDLAPANYSTVMPYCAPQAFGAINGKVTSATMTLAAEPSMWIIAGPTHQWVAPFAWTPAVEAQFPNAGHYGQQPTMAGYWMQTLNTPPTPSSA